MFTGVFPVIVNGNGYVYALGFMVNICPLIAKGEWKGEEVFQFLLIANGNWKTSTMSLDY